MTSTWLAHSDVVGGFWPGAPLVMPDGTAVVFVAPFQPGSASIAFPEAHGLVNLSKLRLVLPGPRGLGAAGLLVAMAEHLRPLGKYPAAQDPLEPGEVPSWEHTFDGGHGWSLGERWTFCDEAYAAELADVAGCDVAELSDLTVVPRLAAAKGQPWTALAMSSRALLGRSA